MRLDVADGSARERGDSLQAADLGRHHPADFVRRHRGDPPAKTRAIGVAWMRADDDTARHGVPDVVYMVSGSLACPPQATLAELTSASIPSSSAFVQGP